MLELHLIGGALFLAMFVRFSVARCCCAEPCGGTLSGFGCNDGTTPRRVQVDFGGAFGDDNCDSCADWHTTSWILQQFGGMAEVTAGGGSADTACNYGSGDIVLPCSGPERYKVCSLFVQPDDIGWNVYIGYRLAVTLQCSHYDAVWSEGTVASAPIDCSVQYSFGSAEFSAASSGEYSCDWSLADGHTLTPLAPFG